MPYKEVSTGKGKFGIKGPNGMKSKHSTKQNADAQLRLLRSIEFQGVPIHGSHNQDKEQPGE